MKTKFILLGSLASLGAAASLNAQSVTPAVGYHTEEISPESFNLIGVNVGNAVAAAGDFEAANNDTDVDFTTLLTDGAPYTVQNIATGDIATVDSWDANNLVTTPALAASAGDRYEIREDQTIGGLFGAANEAGLLEGTDQTADVVWISNGDGTYTRVYYSNVTSALPVRTPGWKSIGGGNADASGTVAPFQFSMFLQRKGTEPLSVVFVGHVRGDDDVSGEHGAKSTNLTLVGDGGFNAVNRIVPVEIMLADSGIQLSEGTDLTGDVLWNPSGAGTYTRVYNNNVSSALPVRTPGLRFVGGGNTDASGELLKSGFLIQRRAAAGVVSVTVPDSLDL